MTMTGPSTVCTSKSASFRYDGLAIGKEAQAAAAAANYSDDCRRVSPAFDEIRTCGF